MTRLLVSLCACSLLLAAGSPVLGDCPANRTFVVTNSYDIDGEPAPELFVTVGYTYTFQLNNPSSHPFMLTASPNGGAGTSALPLSSGVSCVCQGCGTCTRRTITFTPAASLAGQTVYYQCTVHVVMGNAVHIAPAPAITVNTLPQPLNRCAGESAQFTVSATSNETQTLSYQWRKGADAVVNLSGHIAGATSPVLTITGLTTQDAGAYTCVMTAPCKTVTTAPAALAVNTCCPADLGMRSGVAGSDGVLDNNDFIAFIDLYFAGDPRADRGGQGGVPGADAEFDNNDFVVYINEYFAGC